MRFTKFEILEMFARQDTAYRLAALSVNWLRGGKEYCPTAADEARSLELEIGDTLVSFGDLASSLEQDRPMQTITSDFILNQLHALIRAPYELLSDYCEDYDKVVPAADLLGRLQKADWYPFASIIRNAISHNFRIGYGKADRQRLPVLWHGIELTESLEGTTVTPGLLSYELGYELFRAMRALAEALPEWPITE